MRNATFARAAQIVKRVTTEDGVEDQTLALHLDGVSLVVRNGADERRLFGIVNEAFELRLNNADLDAVLQAGLDQLLEAQRTEAKAAPTMPTAWMSTSARTTSGKRCPRACGRRSRPRVLSTTGPRYRSSS